jgi:hypothetical protein
MRIRWVAIYAGLLFLLAATTALLQVSAEGKTPAQSLSAYGQNADAATDQNVKALLEEGKKIFRFDTFGDEIFWGDQLQLHRAIAGEKNGGVGPGLTPKAALAAGLKVDMEALPAALVEQVKANQVNDAVGEPRKLLNSSSNSRFMSRKTLRFVVVRQQHRQHG